MAANYVSRWQAAVMADKTLKPSERLVAVAMASRADYKTVAGLRISGGSSESTRGVRWGSERRTPTTSRTHVRLTPVRLTPMTFTTLTPVNLSTTHVTVTYHLHKTYI